jgi:TRAP transporter TAXI family solute receptor
MVTSGLAALVGLSFIAALGAPSSPVLSEAVKFFRIGTGSTGGTYHPIGGLIASAISNPPGARPCDRGGACGPKGLIAVAQSTGGSVANVEAIRDGQLESGLAQADIAYWAYKGVHIFHRKGMKVEKLRAIANLYPEAVHLVVRKDAKITKIEDLRGKRVSLGPKDSGTRVDAEIILRAFGLTTRSIKAQYLGPGPSADALREGKLDAMFLVAGPPAKAIVGLASSTEIALLPIAGKRVTRLRKRYPFFSQGVIPADSYKNATDIETLTVGAQWVVSADVPARFGTRTPGSCSMRAIPRGATSSWRTPSKGSVCRSIRAPRATTAKWACWAASTARPPANRRPTARGRRPEKEWSPRRNRHRAAARAPRPRNNRRRAPRRQSNS